MTKLSWDQVLAFRLERQFLDSRAPSGSLFEVASALCGVRAQLPFTAELALWARVDGLEPGEVTHALEKDRTLVKTWIRNVLHVVPADDLALYVAVLHPRPEGPGDAWLRMRGVTREQYEAIIENVPRALDGRPRTREWLADRLADLAGPDVREAALFSWGGVLKQSARRGDLCFGPPRGRNVTFVRPDRWLRRTLRVDPEKAGRDFVRRFLTSYGPASAVDFGRWIQEPTRAKALLRASADELSEVEVEPFQALRPKVRKALVDEVELLAAFLGGRPSWPHKSRRRRRGPQGSRRHTASNSSPHEWPREESNLRPQIRSSGPSPDRPRRTETNPSA